MQRALGAPRAAGMAAPSRAFTWKATRIAAKVHPPALLVEYRSCAAAGACALEAPAASGMRVRTFELTNLRQDTDVSGLAKQVLRGLPRALDPATISSVKVQQVLARLVAAAAAAPPAFTTAPGAAPAHAITPPGSPARPLSTPFQHVAGSPEDGPLQAQDSAVTASSASSASATPCGTDASAASSRAPSAQLTPEPQPAAAAAAAATSVVPKLSFASLPRPEPEDSPPLRTRNRSPDPVASSPLLPAAAVAAADIPSTSEAAALAAADIIAQRQQGGSGTPQQLQHHQPAAVAAAGSSGSAAPVAGAASAAVAPAGGAQARVSSTTASEVDEDDCLVMEMSIGGEVDLNKVTEYELQLAKAKMEDTYAANVVRPGDPGYVYDKQVEFATTVRANEWDDEDDEE